MADSTYYFMDMETYETYELTEDQVGDNKYYIIEDICVICGKPVPEGTMVCPACMKKTMERKLIREDGIDEAKSGRNRRYH